MNQSEAADLTKFIRFIREDLKLTVLLIEHHMKFVMTLADSVPTRPVELKVFIATMVLESESRAPNQMAGIQANPSTRPSDTPIRSGVLPSPGRSSASASASST